MKSIERSFEAMLANSRHLTVIAVIASLLSALGAFYMATIDVYYGLVKLMSYGSPAYSYEERVVLRSETITSIIKAVDGYLLAAVMIIFALGLYELFISRIDQLEDTRFSSKVLVIHSLDDLKEKLARVILLILVVKFMQVSLSVGYDTPADVLMLGLGILVVGAAIFLGNLNLGKNKEQHTE